MCVNEVNKENLFDRIRLDSGTRILESSFHNLASNDKMKAVQLLNDKNLTFVSFYVLLPQIELFQMMRSMSVRNLQAVQFCLKDNNAHQTSNMKSVLQWIFSTGRDVPNPADEFEEIINRAATQLLSTFQDRTILPYVTELMFRWHREGKCMHDLAWSYFQSQDIDTMPMVANYLRSENERDNELAYRLLNFKPELQPKQKARQYHNFHTWLNENKRFLYSTRESMQLTSAPKHWKVNLQAKYLCIDAQKIAQTTKNKINASLQNNLKSFQEMKRDDQKLLAKYSYKTHEQDLAVWNGFMKAPIQSQLHVAKAELGGAK